MENVTIAKPPTREDAALGLRIIHSFLAIRPVWTGKRPTLPGYYWLRDRDGNDRPYVVEVSQDYSEDSAPLVVQEYRPEDRGVQYLSAEIYDGCQWAGPLEMPAERG